MPKQCSVRDMKFIEPCNALSRQTALGIRGGVERVAWSNFTSGEPTRTFYSLGGVASRDVKAMALTFCPFCGTKIDAPFCEG